MEKQKHYYAVRLWCADDAHVLDVNDYATEVHVFSDKETRDDWVHEKYRFRNWAKSSDRVIRRAIRQKSEGMSATVPYIEGGAELEIEEED